MRTRSSRPRSTRKVLITGAEGRLGQTLRTALETDPGIAIVSLGSLRSTTAATIGVDVTDAVTFASALADVSPDVVVHLAAITGRECDLDAERARRVNVDAVRTLAASAAPQIVFASTAAVFGTSRRRPVAENDSLELTSNYARFKWEAEQILARRGGGVTGVTGVTILRCFNIFGSRFADSLVNKLARSTEANPVRLVGWEGFVRDYVHADDVVQAIVSVIRNPIPTTRTLNIGSGIATSNKDLVAALSRSRTLYYEVSGDDDSYSCANIERAKAEISFTPTQSFPL